MGRQKRGIPEINAGSMADIAFLLLVFFLVTTTMDIPTGLKVSLPPIPETPPDNSPNKKKEVLEVLINKNDMLLVENEYLEIDQLKEMTIKHLTNNGRLPDFSTSPQNAIVSLKNDRGTSYEAYVSVYNELQRAYNEVRDDYSMKTYGKPYKKLKDKSTAQTDVRETYPIKLSEAEPVGSGK